MSTTKQKLDYHMTMAAHYGASAVHRFGLLGFKEAANNAIDDMEQSLRLAKTAKEVLDAGRPDHGDF